MSKVAVVFPGQGSQKIGMLADIASEYPIIEQTFSEASEVLGYDMWQLVQSGAPDKLNMTEYTQPAMLVSDIAIWRLLQQEKPTRPDCMAGHSLGEYSALVAAGSLEFTDAVKLVKTRGQLMQNAVPEGQGAMAAIIGLDDNAVADLCQQSANGEVLGPANLNATGQVVISGGAAAVDRAISLAVSQGAQMAVLLPMSVPAHSSMMQPAADGLKQELAEVAIANPSVPIIHNVDVQEHNEVEQIRQAMVQQVASPVRWVETIQQIINRGVDKIIECGPGNVLTGLIKRTDPSIDVVPIGSLSGFKEYVGN